MSSDLKADGVESPATRSQPPPERLPFPVEPATASAWAEVLRVLRAEAEAAPERDDRASLLHAVAELEESMLGDQPAAARSYLAAYNARAALRPPLDALVRLYRRRSSFANLGAPRRAGALGRSRARPGRRAHPPGRALRRRPR